MAKAFYPRLSDARNLFPLVRAHLAAAAAHHSLPASLAFDLLPIVEDGVFGYEILPNRETQTFLTIGRDDRGVPLLRRTVYRAEVPRALHLATINGHTFMPGEFDARRHIERQDAVFADWISAAEAAWAALVALFPDMPRHTVEICDDRNQSLDNALAIAQSRLAQCDPCIDFCGVPDEAQYGYALTGADGERGYLALRPQHRWVLQWESPVNAVYSRWSVPPPAVDATTSWARAGMATVEVELPIALHAKASSSVNSPLPR